MRRTAVVLVVVLSFLVSFGLVAPDGARAAAATCPASGQPSPNGDPAVAAVRTIGPAPAWNDGVPTHSRILTVIENRGDNASGPYRIDYHWVAGGSVSWLNEEETSSFDLQPLLAQSTTTHEAAWTLQESHKGDGAVRVVVSTVGDGRPDNNSCQVPIFIPVRQSRLSIEGQEQILRPDETRFVRVILKNQGNLEETYSLTLPNATVQPNHRLVAEFEPATVVVPGGTERTSTLFIAYPFQGETSPLTAHLGVSAQTADGRRLDNTTPAIRVQHDQRPPPSPFEIQRSGPAALTGPPAATLSVPFQIRNAGSDLDVYLLETSTGTGWNVSVLPERLGLLPSESATFTVRIPVSAETPLGTDGEVRLAVRSNRGTAPTVTVLPIRVQGPIVELEHDSTWPGVPHVGDEVRVPIVIHNKGDEATPAGSLVTIVATGLTEETVSESAPVPIIPPDGEASLDFDLGNYESPGLARFLASWSFPGGNITSQGFAREVLVRAGAVEVAAPSPLAGIAGEAVGYLGAPHVFRIRNLGNAEQEFTIELKAALGTGEIPQEFRSLTIQPGETRSVPVYHRLPSPAGRAQEANLTLFAHVSDRTEFSSNATVTTGITDLASPVVRVDELPSVWAVRAALDVGAHATDDGFVDRVLMSIQAPSGATTRLELNAAAGEAWTGRFVPTEPGLHKIVAEAWDGTGKRGVSDAAEFTAAVIDPPEIILDGPAQGASVEPSANFTVRINDTRPVPLVMLTIKDANGETARQAALELDADNATAFDLEGLSPGEIQITVEAINSAGARSHVTRTMTITGPPTPAAIPKATEEPQPSAKSPASPAVVAIIVVAAAAVLRRHTHGRPPP